MPESAISDKSDAVPGSAVTQEEFTRIVAVCNDIAKRRDHKFDPRQAEIKKASSALNEIARVTERSGFLWPSDGPLRIAETGGHVPLPVPSFHTKYPLVNGLLLGAAAQLGLGWKKQPRIQMSGDQFELVWGDIEEAQAEPRKRHRRAALPKAFDPAFSGMSPGSTRKTGRLIRIVLLEGAHGRSYWDLFLRGASTMAEMWGVDLVPVAANSNRDRVTAARRLLSELLSQRSPRPAVHGILACSTGYSVTESFLPAAKEKGIVVLETSYSDSRIRTDKQQWAELMCESISSLIDKTSKPPNVIIVEDGTKENATGIVAQRRDKLIQLLTNPPGKVPAVERLRVICLKTDTTFNGVSASLVRFLNENPPKHCLVVVALTTEMTTGVLNAILKLPAVRKKLAVFGTDFGSRTLWELQEGDTPLRAVVGVDPFRLGQLCVRAMLHAIGQLSEGESLETLPQYVVRPVLLTHEDAKREQIACASDVAEIRPELRLWDQRSCWPTWMAEGNPKALWNLSPEEEAERVSERQELIQWIRGLMLAST